MSLAVQQKAIIICWPSNNRFPYWIHSTEPPSRRDIYDGVLGWGHCYSRRGDGWAVGGTGCMCPQITGNGAPFSI